MDPTNEPDEGIVLKTKKPMSEAQKERIAKMNQKKRENAELRRELLAKAEEKIKADTEAAKIRNKLSAKKRNCPETYAKEMAEQEANTPQLKTDQPVVKREPKIVYESASEDEAEIVIVKKKKPAKKIIYKEESESEEEVVVPKKKKTIASVPRENPILKPVIKFF